MLFSSTSFLFCFLPIVYILYLIVPGIKAKNALLIIASLFFYAWGEPIYIVLMIFSVLTNYLLALLMVKKAGAQKKFFLFLTVCLNIGLLILFKYSGMIIGANTPFKHLPIGISFYTFQALSYCIDVYRDDTNIQKNPLRLMLYISFFPQLIAGPIVKYHDIEAALSARSIDAEKCSQGIVRFIFGLSKKLLIANLCAIFADSLYAEGITVTVTAWVFAILYSLQIYFDFSGYSDMAIGLGKMFGFEFKENFNYPYYAVSIQDFWRRWHISLSTWFKEYLYIPLGGNRKGRVRTVINRFIVFASTGIWHGANVTFLVWGLFHGLFLTIEQLIVGRKKEINEDRKKKSFFVRCLSHIYTLIIVVSGFVIFRADSIYDAVDILKLMFIPKIARAPELGVILTLINPFNILFLVAGIVLSVPVYKTMPKKKVIIYPLCMVLLLLCIMNLAVSTYNPFIYFRF